MPRKKCKRCKSPLEEFQICDCEPEEDYVNCEEPEEDDE